MRAMMIAAAATVMTAAAAHAGPVAGPGQIATVQIVDGVYSAVAPIDIGTAIDLTGLSPKSGQATEEFLALDASAVLPDVIGLALELGTSNNGLSFAIPFDRALLAPGDRVFDMGANDQTGTIVAEITATLGMNLDDPFPTPGHVNIGGTVMFTDASGTYEPTEGAWLLSFAYTENVPSPSGGATLSLSTDISIIPTSVTEPGVLGLLGLGVLGLGLAARRRG